MELPRPFDIYDLEENSITPEEAERAVLHFIYQVESDWQRPFPQGLLKFIAKGLRTQYESGNITAWTCRKSGRPSVASNDSLNMLAWYLCNMDTHTRFCNLPRTVGSGRYFKVAELFKSAAQSIRKLAEKSPYKQEYKASVLSDRPKKLWDLDSETSIKRVVKDFQNNGLYNSETIYENIQNEAPLEIFCTMVLELPKEEIGQHMEAIFTRWKENNKV